MKTKKQNPRSKRMFHGLQKAKRSINVKGQWKAVELDPSLFAEEGMEGLVCFEELTNYSMLDSEKIATEVEKEPKRNKKAKKRKCTGEEEAVVEVAVESKADETVEPAKKKAKKKKKSKTQLKSEESDHQDGTKDVARGEAAGKNRATHEDIVKGVNSAISDPDAFPKPSKRSKKRKKQNQQSEKDAVTVESSNPESNSEHQNVVIEKFPKNKMPKPVKRQQKNWTEAVLDDGNDRKTDVSAWKDLFVPAPVLKALSSLGFGSPTPIQALTLPSAIRDHKDILGAAETGKLK